MPQGEGRDKTGDALCSVSSRVAFFGFLAGLLLLLSGGPTPAKAGISLSSGSSTTLVLLLACASPLAQAHADLARGSGRRRLQGDFEATQVDLYIVVDSSGSIPAANPSCFAKSGQKCWEQATAYVFNITAALEAQMGGWAVVTNGVVGSTGLGMACYTFSCGDDGLSTVNVTGDELVYNDQALKGVVYYMRELIAPSGSTCPSTALSSTLQLMRSQPAYRPNQMVVVLTDGLIDASDVAATQSVAQDLASEGAGIFVVAIGEAGWDSETVASMFGDIAKLVFVASFADLASSVNELSNGIASGVAGPAPTPVPTTLGVKHASPTPENPAAAGSGPGPSTATAAVLGVCIGGSVIGSAIFISRHRRTQRRQASVRRAASCSTSRRP